MVNFHKKLMGVCLFFLFIFIFNYVKSRSKYTDQLHKDLKHIIFILKHNHPGYINQEDNEFKKIVNDLESHYFLLKASSRDEYIFILKESMQLFNDSHLSVCDRNEMKFLNMNPSDHFSIIEKKEKEIIKVIIPHFNINQESLNEYNKVLLYLKEYEGDDAIIFDLRNNYGGNSQYASLLLQSLFGTNYYNYVMSDYYQKNHVYVDWRVSDENLKHLIEIKLLYENNQAVLSWIEPIIKGFYECQKNSILYYREQIKVEKENSNGLIKSKYNGTIIFLTNKKCVSACLDFIDELYILSEYNNNKVIQIGEETNKDSVYMEVRSIQLSDDNVYFNFPIKVYRNRKRKNNQSYKPDIAIEFLK
jgi:hypothetical protein